MIKNVDVVSFVDVYIVMRLVKNIKGVNEDGNKV